MADELTRFHTTGPSWAERASLGGLEAVLSPVRRRENVFLHGIHSYGAAIALTYLPPCSYLLDFGCGNGRFARYFASKGRKVLGTEITWQMVADAKSHSPLENCEFVITDGISIPVKDDSIGGVWRCAVLRYSLLVSDPCYAAIAMEMFRVLQPGACVVNCEMYVDVPPERFVRDFEQAGFQTRRVAVLNRYNGVLERCLRNRWIPGGWLQYSAALCAGLRSRLDNPGRPIPGLRDYLFIWQKPNDIASGAHGDVPSRVEIRSAGITG